VYHDGVEVVIFPRAIHSLSSDVDEVGSHSN